MTSPRSLTISLPPLHEAQREIAESPARFKVAACGRRWGKTRLGVRRMRPGGPRRKRAWWIAPSFPVASVAWREARALARQIPGVLVRESERELIFPGPGGGTVRIKSADSPDSLEGRGSTSPSSTRLRSCPRRRGTSACVLRWRIVRAAPSHLDASRQSGFFARAFARGTIRPSRSGRLGARRRRRVRHRSGRDRGGPALDAGAHLCSGVRGALHRRRGRGLPKHQANAPRRRASTARSQGAVRRRSRLGKVERLLGLQRLRHSKRRDGGVRPGCARSTTRSSAPGSRRYARASGRR